MNKLLLILVCAITAVCNAQNDSGGSGSTGVFTGGKKKDICLLQYDKSGDPIVIAGNGKKKDYTLNQTDSGGNGVLIGSGGKKMDYTGRMVATGGTGGSGTVVGGTTLGKKQDFCNCDGEPIKTADPKKRDLASNDTGGGAVIIGIGKKADFITAIVSDTGGTGSSPGSIKKQDFTIIKLT